MATQRSSCLHHFNNVHTILLKSCFVLPNLNWFFRNEKEDEVKKNSIEDVDLTLPGWGSWAGHNMKPVSRRKRKKFVIKFPRIIPRRDSNRGNVIINEDADKSIKKHQVSSVGKILLYTFYI